MSTCAEPEPGRAKDEGNSQTSGSEFFEGNSPPVEYAGPSTVVELFKDAGPLTQVELFKDAGISTQVELFKEASLSNR